MTEQDNIETIRNITDIAEVKKIELNDIIKEKLGPELSITAEKNSKDIFIYKISYISQGHKVAGFIIEPRNRGDLPCIVYNRGGSNDFGAIKIGQLFLDLSIFARSGYITFFSQYSGNAGSEGIDEMGGSDIEDVLRIHEIIKKFPRADKNRIGMYGISRGGIMTYLALAKSDWIKSAVVVAGPTDIVNVKDFRPKIDNHYGEMFGHSLEERKKRSVLYWPEKLPKDVPILLMHGTADWRVNPLDTMRLAEKLYENKIPYRLIMFEGADHELSEFKSEMYNTALSWFDRFVKNRKPLPDLKPHGK